MPITLAEAAAACGIDRSTIRRALKSGKISGSRNAHGSWIVEPSELFRVFPAAASTAADTAAVPQHAATDALIAELRRALDDLRRDKDGVIEDLRVDRDAWKEQAQRLALPGRAADEPSAKSPSVPTVIVARRPWWPWRRAG